MDKKNFEIYREKIFNHFNQNFINNYPEIEGFFMCTLPQNLQWDVEFIFKIKHPLSYIDKLTLKKRLSEDLVKCCGELANELYYSRILVIFDDTEDIHEY